MIKVKEAIIVEGKYDKIKLSGFIDGLIITTDGFGVFKDKEKLKLIRRLADERGLLVLTDSDGAGFVIRNFLKGSVPKEKLKHAYIPDIFGKERRKTSPSKEGKLGVEGISETVLVEAITRSGACCELCDKKSIDKGEISKNDFFDFGLTGGTASAEKRNSLKETLGLPQKLSTNSMLNVLNCIMTREEFFELMKKTNEKEGFDD